MKKRIGSLLLALAIMFSMIPVSAVNVDAADTDTVPVIAVENVWAASGSAVEVNINITNNPGILGATLTVSWDEGLTMIGDKNGEAFAGTTYQTPSRYNSSGTNFIWYGSSLSAVQDGTVLTLTFQVSETATETDVFAINVTCKSDDVFDQDKNLVSVSTENGSVQVVNYKPGDVTGDDNVNILDLIKLSQFLSDGCVTDPEGYNVTINEMAADVNDSGSLNTLDLILISQYISDDCTTDPEGYNIILKPSTPKCSHTMTATEAKDATCTKDGNRAYWYCTTCVKYFSDENGNTEVALADTIVAATGHTEEIIPGEAPDYDKSGWTDGVRCSVCQETLVPREELDPLQPDQLYVEYVLDPTTTDSYLQTEINKKLVAGKTVNPNPSLFNTTSQSHTLMNIDNGIIVGYEFQGWYTDTTDTAQKIDSIQQGQVGTVKLYARWKKTTFYVTFNAPLLPVSSVERTIDATTYLPEKSEMAVPYYIFMGWSDASGRIIDKIEPGVGNVTVYANWTSSTRNVAVAENYKNQTPIVIEDNEQYLFVYNIGTIRNVPLVTMADYEYSEGNLVIDKTEFEEKTYGENEAKTVNTTVANATTHSSSWTLSEDWNELITEIEGKEQTVTEGSVIAISDGTSKAYSSQGSSYVGNSFHASNDSLVTSKTITDDSWKNSAEVEASLSYGPAKVSAGISGEQAHSEHQEDYKETNSSLEVSSDWNASSGYSASSNSNHTEERTQSILNAAMTQWKHEISKSLGGSAGQTSEETSATTESESYISTIKYYSDTTKGSSITETRTFNVPGYYRYVMYAKVHVYAVVGYDMQTGAYFVRTYSALDDNLSYGFDYSADGSYKDYDNGVLPFEVPIFVYDYIYDAMAKTENIVIDRNGIVTDYLGTATEVLIPDYASFNNNDGTYDVVPVVGLESDVFENNSEITSVKLGKYITAIPDNAFKERTSLESVKYEELVSIGNYAFDGCTSLKNFEVSESVTNLGTNAFNGVVKAAVRASNANVAEVAVSSGAQTLSVYLDNLTDDEVAKLSNVQLKTSDGTTEYFAIYGYGKTYNNISIESNALKTVINRMTFENNTNTPLILKSETVELFAVNINDAPNIAMQLNGDQTNIIITGINNISTQGDIAILSKELDVSLPTSITETTSLNVVGGDVVVYGAIDELTSFKYLVVSDGVIRSITETEYEALMKTYYLTFDANDGSVDITSKAVMLNSVIGELPTPTREGFTFMGWFDENGTQVTEKTKFEYQEDITLKAKWQSGYVLATEVPEDAQIVSEKWTYNLTTNITSDQDFVDGYTLYDTTSEWGEYGEWSDWSTTEATASDSREVETKTVTDKAGYTQYRYWRYRKDGATNIHYCTTCGASYYGGTWYKEYTDWSNSPKSVAKYYSCGHVGTVSVYGTEDNYYYYQETRWIDAVTHTEYRFRDRELVYTYYHTKTEVLESVTEVVETDSISNVQKWVQYIV